MFSTYNYIEHYSNIEALHIKIRALNDSFSLSTEDYRKFAKELDIDFDILRDCIHKYENTLLISCYTFSEQLTKNFIFHIVDVDNESNRYIQKYLRSNLIKENLSLYIKSSELMSDTFRNLFTKMRFIISNIQYNDKYLIYKEETLYNEMIVERHRYAHANNHNFKFENYQSVIDFLDYIIFEYTMISKNHNSREKLFEIQTELNKKIKEAVEKINEQVTPKDCFQRIKELSVQFVEITDKEFSRHKLLSNYYNLLEIYSKLDFRLKINYIDLIDKFKEINI
ncbi:MAG: hypothetical protein ACYDEI_05275 [Erysipelotrichaceae bacterium]